MSKPIISMNTNKLSLYYWALRALTRGLTFQLSISPNAEFWWVCHAAKLFQKLNKHIAIFKRVTRWPYLFLSLFPNSLYNRSNISLSKKTVQHIWITHTISKKTISHVWMQMRFLPKLYQFGEYPQWPRCLQHPSPPATSIIAIQYHRTYHDFVSNR